MSSHDHAWRDVHGHPASPNWRDLVFPVRYRSRVAGQASAPTGRVGSVHGMSYPASPDGMAMHRGAPGQGSARGPVHPEAAVERTTIISPVPPVSQPHDWSEGYWRHNEARGWEFIRPGDPLTPLFNELWERHMGKHVDANGDGIADQAQEELREPERFAHDDGSVYERVSPEEFELAEDESED